jgi:phage replication-related protein YjqB (UPF0714/DUF867 family)
MSQDNFRTQVTLIDSPFMNDQYCTVPSDLNLQVGDQVRVGYHTRVAIYTVKWLTAEKNVIRLNGKVRLDISEHQQPEAAVGYVQGPSVVCPKPLLDTEARIQSEFVERVADDGLHEGFICIAPHGGHIDLKTDFQADRVHKAMVGTSMWMCKGFTEGGGAFRQWHTTSNDISPNSFPELKKIVNSKRKFKHCVAFHGMAEGGVLIGGLGPESLKLQLQRVIREKIDNDSIPVRLATWNDCCNGLSNRNIVNWLTKGGLGGIQIEQDRKVRHKYWQCVADAVIEVFAPLFIDENSSYYSVFGEDY